MSGAAAGDTDPAGPAQIDWSQWLAVCGLKSEANVWGGRAVCGGGRADLLAQRIAAAVADERPAGIVSFGICGALRGAVAVGALVAARRIVEVEGRAWPCDSAGRAGLIAVTGARPVEALGSDEGVAEPEQKAKLATLADVVDMESQVAARLAQAHGLPFVMLRAVSDDASHRLPPAAMAAMQPDGGVSLAAVLGSLAREPSQLPDLIRMARCSAKAFDTLKAARHDLWAAR